MRRSPSNLTMIPENQPVSFVGAILQDDEIEREIHQSRKMTRVIIGLTIVVCSILPLIYVNQWFALALLVIIAAIGMVKIEILRSYKPVMDATEYRESESITVICHEDSGYSL